MSTSLPLMTERLLNHLCEKLTFDELEDLYSAIDDSAADFLLALHEILQEMEDRDMK